MEPEELITGQGPGLDPGHVAQGQGHAQGGGAGGPGAEADPTADPGPGAGVGAAAGVPATAGPGADHILGEGRTLRTMKRTESSQASFLEV